MSAIYCCNLKAVGTHFWKQTDRHADNFKERFDVPLRTLAINCVRRHCRKKDTLNCVGKFESLPGAMCMLSARRYERAFEIRCDKSKLKINRMKWRSWRQNRLIFIFFFRRANTALGCIQPKCVCVCFFTFHFLETASHSLWSAAAI